MVGELSPYNIKEVIPDHFYWTISNMTDKRKSIRGSFGSYNYLSNHGSSTQGFGVQQQNNGPVGYVSVAGNAEAPRVIANGSILYYAVDQGVWFQAVGCDIDIEYTLEPVQYAQSEEANKNGLVHWCNKLTVTKDTIVESEIRGFSAIKATFKGNGILYVAAR